MYVKRKTILAATAIGASIALASSACSSSGSDDSSSQGPSSSSETGSGDSGVSTEIPDDDITLTLSYIDDPPTEGLVKGFEAKHSNVSDHQTHASAVR